MSDLVVVGERVLVGGAFVPATVYAANGRISLIEPGTPSSAPDEAIVLASDEVLIPGLVDTHVHINEPGRTEWEGFATATRAAAAGGVTTVLDMPLNSIPPTVDVSALAVKQRSAQAQVSVDVGFWGGAIPSSLGRLRELHDAGVWGFKCFLLDSGAPEFPHLSREQLETAMREIATFDGLLIVHAEDGPSIHGLGYTSLYDDFLKSRPKAAENNAIATVIDAVRRTGCRTHIVHLSSAEALPMLISARADGLPISVETCPHYLCLDAESIPDGQTQYKCCPPIREAANRELLWEALADGHIDFVVSDHSPSTPELKLFKTGDFGHAWGGISSLQLGLSLIWSEARTRGHDLAQVVSWMAERPASVIGVWGKGTIEVGAAADLAVFAPDESFVVDPAKLYHRHAVTPYAGRALSGVVRQSILAGRPITSEPAGRLLSRR